MALRRDVVGLLARRLVEFAEPKRLSVPGLAGRCVDEAVVQSPVCDLIHPGILWFLPTGSTATGRHSDRMYFVLARHGFFRHSSSTIFGHQAKPLMAPLALAAGISSGRYVRLMAGRMPKLWGCVYAVIVVILFPYDDVEMAWATNFPDKTTLSLLDRPRTFAPQAKRPTSQNRGIHPIALHSLGQRLYLGFSRSQHPRLRATTLSNSLLQHISALFSGLSSFVGEQFRGESFPKFIVINQIERYSDEWFPPPPQWVCEYVCRHCVLARQFSTIKIFQVVGSGGGRGAQSRAKISPAKSFCKIPEAL